mmetsp:Transcript_62912/g.111752  ORF Transcript_62912/g.111752 Transcript_62912/m.111752 type:complete len:254 (-) Transcript_62912:647-1408(-)
MSKDCDDLISGGPRKLLGAFFVLLGLSFAARLIWNLVQYPIWPLEVENADWAFQWLVTTIFDYYALTACLCCIMIASEESLLQGLLWAAAVLLLGAPVACAYIVKRIIFHGTIELAGSFSSLANPNREIASCVSSWRGIASIAFYAALGTSFLGRLVWTLCTHPLLPVQSENADWASSWLLTTVLDYYTAALCLCGIILSTDSLAAAIIWCLCILCLGAPFADAYVASRLLLGGSVHLDDMKGLTFDRSLGRS